jgi:hypothetical protein
MFWPIPSKHCSVNAAQQTLFGKRQPLGMRRSALPAVRKRRPFESTGHPPFESTVQQPRENLSAAGKLPV